MPQLPARLHLPDREQITGWLRRQRVGSDVIRQMRMKFVAVAMAILIAVFLTMLSSINMIMQTVSQSQSMRLLVQIAESDRYNNIGGEAAPPGGMIPPDGNAAPPDGGQPPDGNAAPPDGGQPPTGEEGSPEAETSAAAEAVITNVSPLAEVWGDFGYGWGEEQNRREGGRFDPGGNGEEPPERPSDGMQPPPGEWQPVEPPEWNDDPFDDEPDEPDEDVQPPTQAPTSAPTQAPPAPTEAPPTAPPPTSPPATAQEAPAPTNPAEPAAAVIPPEEAPPPEEVPPPEEAPPDTEEAQETQAETQPESTEPAVTDVQETTEPPTERETPPPPPADDGRGGMQRMDKWNLTITIDHFALLSDTEGNFLALRNTEDYTTEEAEEIMNGILSLGKKQGMYGWLQYYITEKDYGTLIVVTDKTSDQGLLNKLFTSTVIIGILTLLVLLGFLIFFSHWITRPVQTAFDRQKQFVSDAGHELKTPLAVLSANADILQDEIGENKWLGYMQEQTGRMSQLVGDLLRLARMDNPAQEYVFQDFNLSTAVAATALPFESAAFEKHRNLEIDIQPDVTYRGSEQHIRQLCAIFIDNALKYSDENGIIKITLLKRGDNCILEFYNTGCEIGPEETQKIFERFYRGDKARNNKGKNGYGLGLAIAKSIMDVHRIKIRVTCEQGGWIRFLLTM